LESFGVRKRRQLLSLALQLDEWFPNTAHVAEFIAQALQGGYRQEPLFILQQLSDKLAFSMKLPVLQCQQLC
jgi:hypothetical protein